MKIMQENDSGIIITEEELLFDHRVFSRISNYFMAYAGVRDNDSQQGDIGGTIISLDSNRSIRIYS